MRRRVVVGFLAVLALMLGACNADTEPATQVTSTSATLHATVDWDQGEDVAYWFEYRRLGTTDWTRDDVHDPGPLGGSGARCDDRRALSGLAAGVTYEYRLCGYRTAPILPVRRLPDLLRRRPPLRSAERLRPCDDRPESVAEGLHGDDGVQRPGRPTAVRFSPDGRVFVAEKSGLIKVFSGLSDTTPDVVADLRPEVLRLRRSGTDRDGPGSQLPDEELDLRAVRATTRRSAGPRRPTTTSAPSAPARASVRLSRTRPQRPRASADRRIGASSMPSHSSGQLGVRARRRALRHRRRQRRLQLRRLRPGRQPEESLRRSSRSAWERRSVRRRRKAGRCDRRT